MASLNELYQNILIEHNRNPVGFGELNDATHEARGYNPLCGDDLIIDLTIDNNVVTAARFRGDSCAISTASASILMKNLVGKSLEDAQALIEQFSSSLTDGSRTFTDEELVALMGVKEFPARIKCALLPWRTAEAAMQSPNTSQSDSLIEVSTE